MDAMTNEKDAKVKNFKIGMGKAYDHLLGLFHEVSELENEASILANDLDDDEIASWSAHLYIVGLNLSAVMELFQSSLPY